MILRSLRALTLGLVVFGHFGCGQKAPEPTKVEKKSGPEPEAKKVAEAAVAEPKRPQVQRVSRPDEYFHFTLSGPVFESPQLFTFDPDSVRINVIKQRSAIQYVRQGNTKATAPDGSQVVVNQIQWASAVPGDYAHDDKRTFVVTLGIESGKHEAATLHLASGMVTTLATNTRPKELKGHFEGKLERTNKGKEGEVYEIRGEFNLAE